MLLVLYLAFLLPLHSFASIFPLLTPCCIAMPVSISVTSSLFVNLFVIHSYSALSLSIFVYFATDCHCSARLYLHRVVIPSVVLSARPNSVNLVVSRVLSIFLTVSSDSPSSDTLDARNRFDTVFLFFQVLTHTRSGRFAFDFRSSPHHTASSLLNNPFFSSGVAPMKPRTP